jgi:hypothetical protein
VVGIVFAVLLAFGISYTNSSIFITMIVESGQLNRDVASGNPSYYLNGSYSEGHSGLFNVNATAVFPRAVVLSNSYVQMNVTFAMMLPSNVSYFSCDSVQAILSLGPKPYLDPNPDKWLAYGGGPLYSEVVINGESRGGTGVGLWAVPVGLNILWPPPANISQNQSWLSFASQADAHLSVLLQGDGVMTAANGTNYSYGFFDPFNFPGVAATVYVLNIPAGDWLGVAVGIGVFALYYFGSKERRNKLW